MINLYTVDKIENDVVVLEDRNTKEIKYIDINECDKDIKENVILDYDVDNKMYIINKEETIKIKFNIRNRFNKLKK